QPPSSVANEGLSSAPEPKPKITELPKEPGQTAQQLSEPKPDTQLAMVTVPDTSQPAPPSPGAPPVPQTPPAEPELTLQPPASPTPAQPPSGPATAGGGSGTPGTAGAESEREIGARKSRLTSVGVSRIGVAAFDVAESPFGAYDKAIVRAVQSRWYALIEKNALYERAGEVTIYFQLLPDGSVTNATVKSTTAGEILALFCQKAIVESAPFGPWPEEVRAYVGNEPRDVYFTFYY
ncbi:MAG: hypothetical protein N3B01_05710, partial [Verrucomicrobiae bacterium]|nr:hypothetical protein [Verrucomicrobiae bacterium]